MTDARIRFVTCGARLAGMLVWPGELASGLFGAEDPNARLLIRLFVNTTIYGIVGAIVALLLA